MGSLYIVRSPNTPATSSILIAIANTAAAAAREIIEMNRRGEKPLNLGGKQSAVAIVEVDYQNVVGQDDLTRFDKKKNNKNNGNRNNKQHDRRNNPRRNNEKGNAPRSN